MNIGLKIKELRKAHGLTQERLAEYLNVSSQAVSKWETGTALPDITLVPKLSSIFSVSTDELFSTKPEITDRKVAEYKNMLAELINVYDYSGVAKLMEQALSEYPSNHEFMWELAHALSHKRRGERGLEKIIFLCEKIVEDCRDETLKCRAITQLCISYAENGERQKALNLISTLPDEPVEKQRLLEMVLTGDEKIKQAQENLLYGLETVVHHLIMLSSESLMGDELSFDEKIEFSNAALRVYSTIFRNGHKADNNGTFRHIYERLSELYLGKGDVENGIKHLRLAAESSEYYDNSVGRGDPFDILFINRCHNEKNKYHYIDTVRLLQLMDRRPAFDLVRETEEFKEIHKQLETAAKKSTDIQD